MSDAVGTGALNLNSAGLTPSEVLREARQSTPEALKARAQLRAAANVEPVGTEGFSPFEQYLEPGYPAIGGAAPPGGWFDATGPVSATQTHALEPGFAPFGKPGGQTGGTTPTLAPNIAEEIPTMRPVNLPPSFTEGAGNLALMTALAAAQSVGNKGGIPTPTQPGRFKTPEGGYGPKSAGWPGMVAPASSFVTNEVKWGDTATPKKVAAAQSKAELKGQPGFQDPRAEAIQKALQAKLMGGQ